MCLPDGQCTIKITEYSLHERNSVLLTLKDFLIYFIWCHLRFTLPKRPVDRVERIYGKSLISRENVIV